MSKLLPVTLITLTLAGAAGIILAKSQSNADETIFTPEQNVLILGWDGVQRQAFFDCYEGKSEECVNGLPNIKELSNDNIYEMTITNGQTCTKPGWSQIFTGYEVDDLHVYNNLNFKPIPEGYSVFERLEDHFDEITTVFLGGKAGNIGGICYTEKTNYENMKGEPWCLTKDNIDYYQNAIGPVEQVSDKIFETLEEIKDERFFMFVQYEEPDFPGIHFHGADTAEYRREMKAVDNDLGKILNWLEENDLDDETIVYVISDHGAGKGLAHRNAPYSIFATNDKRVIREGDRMDFAPTFLEIYGIDPDIYSPEIDGTSMYRLHDDVCISEGENYLDYEGAPKCCDGLTKISFARDYIHGNPVCVEPHGDDLDNSGYCTYCGDGDCNSPENKCNCPEDCKKQQ